MMLQSMINVIFRTLISLTNHVTSLFSNSSKTSWIGINIFGEPNRSEFEGIYYLLRKLCFQLTLPILKCVLITELKLSYF